MLKRRASVSFHYFCKNSDSGFKSSASCGQSCHYLFTHYFFTALLIVIACMGLTICSRPAHAVDLDALIGFGQSTTSGARYRPDSWTPLTVYLTGQSARGEGQLQILVRHGGHSSTYTRHVSLRDGAMNTATNFVIDLHSTDYYGQQSVSDINISLFVDGRKLAAKHLALPGPIDSSAYSILALTRDNSGLNFLTKKKLGLVHRHVNPATLQQSRFAGGVNGDDENFHNGINPNAVLQLLYTDARALPGLPQAYEAIDAITLADQPLDSLTEDQTESIKNYVRGGGLLIISGGGDLARLRSQFFADLLPITPRGVTSKTSLPELEKRYGAPLGTEAPVQTVITEGSLKPGAYALLGGQNGTTPLVSARSYGAGRVVFTSFDYVDPTFRGWKGAPALWRDLLRSGNEEIQARDLLSENGEQFQGSGQRMADALAGKQASSAPNIWTIAGFLLAYITLLIPVNYFLLKRLDKREMAWVSIPVLIVGFTVTSYLLALSIKGGLLSVNRVVVVETCANSNQAAGYGQLTIYSPRRAAYNIAINAGSADAHMFSPREALTNNQSALPEITVDSTPGQSGVRGAMIFLWDKRSFDSPLTIAIGEGITAQTRMLPDHTTEVIVTNKTPYSLKSCALLADDANIDIGDLEPGQTSVPKNIHWAARTAAVNIPFRSMLSNPSMAGVSKLSLDKTSTHDKITLALAESLSKSGERNSNYYAESGRGFGHSANVFVGWFSDPLMNVRIDGKPAPSGEEVNLLVVHLPLPEKSLDAVQKKLHPFMTKPVLELQDETLPGTRRAGRG